MTQKDFIEKMAENFARCLAIVKIKNSDYSVGDDAFRNFNACVPFGIDPKTAILVRMTDKMMRVSNLLKQDAKVTDESIYDTLDDLANYSQILSLYIKNEKS